MNYVYRCMIVIDDEVELARQVWATLDAEYANEFRIALASQSDPTVTTHWMSAGLVTENAAALMPYTAWAFVDDTWVETEHKEGSPDVVAQMCRDNTPPLEVTDAQVEVLWQSADVTDQPVATAFDRLGLTYTVLPEAEDV